MLLLHPSRKLVWKLDPPTFSHLVEDHVNQDVGSSSSCPIAAVKTWTEEEEEREN